MKPLKTGDLIVADKDGFIRKARKNETPLGIKDGVPFSGYIYKMKTKDGIEHIIGIQHVSSLLIKPSGDEVQG